MFGPVLMLKLAGADPSVALLAPLNCEPIK
jgi:hypothetical protein